MTEPLLIHVTIYSPQRKFVREDFSASERGQLYNLFREWVTTQYPPAGVLTDTDWEVMADDSTKRYIASHATSSNMKQYLNFSNVLLTVIVTL